MLNLSAETKGPPMSARLATRLATRFTFLFIVTSLPHCFFTSPFPSATEALSLFELARLQAQQKQTTCAHLFPAPSQPIQNKPLAHTSKNDGGIPPKSE